jgi:hypothetical protein
MKTTHRDYKNKMSGSISAIANHLGINISKMPEFGS